MPTASGLQLRLWHAFARERDGVDRNAGLLRLPGRTRDSAFVFIAVRNESDAMQQARRKRRHRLPDGRFQIGASPIHARGVRQVETASFSPSERGVRANGITSI